MRSTGTYDRLGTGTGGEPRELATLAGIGALYVGRALHSPLALLLNALLRPVVRRLERRRVSTAVGATAVSLGLLSVLVGGGFALVNPTRVWVSQLPATFEAAGRKLAPARQSWSTSPRRPRP